MRTKHLQSLRIHLTPEQEKKAADLVKKYYETRKKTCSFDISKYCFKEQLDFINDRASFKTAVCSRRAGKTVACAAHLIKASLEKEKAVSLYITLSRSNAKKIIWPELTSINRTYDLGGKVNESDLSITFPNKSVIYLSGASNKTEVDKFRGLPIYLCYIDEAQSFPPYIQRLVDAVISKALLDFAGTLCLTGTPGPTPMGYFYDCSHSDKWAKHHWTMFQNPFLPPKSNMTHQELLQRELDRKGVTVDNPTIQRECFGKWATDNTVLVFQYSKDLNDYDELPQCVSQWNYIIGADVGFEDADAIAVLAYNKETEATYLVEEKITHHQGVSQFASDILVMLERYKPDRIVMDTGGLGKKIAEELAMRYSIPIVAAEKTRKLEFIEILNDAMRTKKLFAKTSSRFAQDCNMVQWELDDQATDERGEERKIKFVSEKRKISDSFHSDICDAVLYGFRESLHWLYEAPADIIRKGTPEYFERVTRELEEAQIDRLHKSTEDPWENGRMMDDPWSNA